LARRKKLKTPRQHGRPIGKKWDKAICYMMHYAPDALGGDHRAVWVIIGKKWVYASTSQICKSGGNRKCQLPKQAWEKLINKQTLMEIA
jgi:hypothetical protein|tara:strand:- start:1551 stop:1817 length:267 start_codon:yes stop_codon:yes gene_type:complete